LQQSTFWRFALSIITFSAENGFSDICCFRGVIRPEPLQL